MDARYFSTNTQSMLLAWKYASKYSIYEAVAFLVLAFVLYDGFSSAGYTLWICSSLIISLTLYFFALYFKKHLQIEQGLGLNSTLFAVLNMLLGVLWGSSLFLYQAHAVPSADIFHITILLLVMMFISISNISFIISTLLFNMPIVVAIVLWLAVHRFEHYEATIALIVSFWLLLMLSMLKYNRQYKILLASMSDNITLAQNFSTTSELLDAHKILLDKTKFDAERKYQYLVEYAPEAILVVNEAGDILYANDRAYKLFNYEPGALLGSKVESLVPPRFQNHGQMRREFTHRPRQTRMAENRDVFCLRRDGSEFFADISLIPVSEEGETRTYVYVRDVSMQKYVDAVVKEMKENAKIHEELRIEKEKLQIYLDSEEVVLIVVNSALEIENINKKGLELIGKTRSDGVSLQDVAELLGRHTGFEMRQYLGNTLTGDGRRSDYFTSSVAGINHDKRDLEWSISRAIGADDKPIVLISGIDISKRTRLESVISGIASSMLKQKHDSLLESIIKSLSETLKADAAYVAMLDGSKERMLRTMVVLRNGSLVDNIDIQLNEAMWNEVRLAKTQMVLNRENTSPIYHELLAEFDAQAYLSIPLLDANGVLLGVLALFYVEAKPSLRLEQSVCGIYSLLSVSEIERLNNIREKDNINRQLQQSQKMESIGQLTGGIAHDFNNMLASMLGFAELGMLRTEGKDEKLYTYLQNIYQTGGQAKELIAQMLTFSRQIPGSLHELNISDVIAEAVKMIGPILPSSIELKVDVEKDLPMVNGDNILLGQSIVNLLINARDAIGETGVIHISCTYQRNYTARCTSCLKEYAAEMVVITVTDTGCGIDYENLETIFEPFVTNKDIGKGTGMGLAMVHGIVHEHGGHVQAHTVKGQGTEMSIVLPAIKVNAGGHNTKVEGEAMNETSGLGKRVMVVDDEPMVANLLTEILTLNDFEVDTFYNSTEALDIYRKSPQKYALLITDYTMPTMTGAEFAKRILDINNSQSIILCTGYSEYIDEERAKKMGIAAYLNKPVSHTQFMRTVYELINKK